MIRVYLPEPDVDIGPMFRVRNPGLKDSPPRNSPPIAYGLLFLEPLFGE